jgi:hypothetical protein
MSVQTVQQNEDYLSYGKECDLTSSTSPGVIISGGDSMMLSPATLMSIPRFSHSAPNIDPTPEITNQEFLSYSGHFLRHLFYSSHFYFGNYSQLPF